MAIDLPENYEEPQDEDLEARLNVETAQYFKDNKPEQLYYGPYREPEGDSIGVDLLKVYSDMEQGAISSGNFISDLFKDKSEVPQTTEKRTERNMRIQKAQRNLKSSGAMGIFPALLGYLQAENETDVFKPSGEVRKPDTWTGIGASIVPYIAGTSAIAKILPKAIPLVGRVIAGEQVAEQIVTSDMTNLANVIDSLPSDYKAPLVEEAAALLSADSDDTEAELRFKKSIVALGATGLILGVFKAVPVVAKGSVKAVEKGVTTAKGGILATQEGIQALKNLRASNPAYKKPVEEFTEEEGVEVILQSTILAREQAAKARIATTRASNIRGEGVGVPTGKPRPTRDAFEEGAEGTKQFKTALTKWKTKDTAKSNLPTEASILTETAEGISQVAAQNKSFLKRIQQRYFTARGYYTPKAQTLFDDSQTAQKSAMQEASNISLRIQKALDNIGQATALEAAKSGRKTTALDNVNGLPTREGILTKVTGAFEFNATKFLYELPRSERIEFYRTNFGLPENIAREVYNARELMDGFSRRIYNSSAMTLQQKTSLESGLGSYVRRSYRAWEDPGFVPDLALKPDAVEATYQQLLKQPQIATVVSKLQKTDEVGEKLDDYLETIRSRAVSEVESKLTFVQDRQVVDFISQIRGVPKLHTLTDINEPLRKLLGEIEDPLERLVLSVSKSSRIYEQSNFYNRLSTLGRNGNWLGDLNEVRTVKIEGTNNFSLDGFATDEAAKAAGLPNAASSWTYTTPEIARAINNKEVIPSWFDMGGSGGETLRAFAAAKGATQSAKTVYNHTVHIRNAYGGFHFTVANGINPFVRDGYTPFKVLADDIRQGGDEAMQSQYNKFIDLGIVDTNVRLNEFRELISAGFEKNPADWVNKTILSPESKFRKLLEPITPSPETRNFAPHIYRATDDYAKMNAWAYELKTLKQARPNEPLDVLEQEAAEIVKNTMPNYSRVPKGVKQLRYLPVGAFTGFASESVRTTAHIVARGVKEIGSKNPTLQKRGAQRLAGFIAAGGIGFSGISAGSQYLMGWDKEDAKSYNILAEGRYSTDANRIWSYDSNGKPQFVDTKSLDAFSVIRDPFVIIANRALIGEFEGEELDAYIADATMRATLNFIQPYAGQSMLADGLSRLGFATLSEDGRDLEGKPIFQPKMDTSEKAIAAVDVLFSIIEPGAIPNIEKLNEALQGIENPDYPENSRDVTTELYANFLGFRKNKFDPDRAMKTAVKNYLEKTKNNFTRKLNLDPEVIAAAPEDYLKVQKVERNLQQDLYVVAKAYAHLYDRDSEYPFENTLKLLKEYGIKDTNLRHNIVMGNFTPDDANQVSKTYTDRIKMGREFPEADATQTKLGLINYNMIHERLDKYQEESWDYELQEEMSKRMVKNKGGEVLDVPNVPTEPDQRIDKMTGLPYDQQAGTAFVDQEDPLRRLGFAGGGDVDPLRRLGFGVGGKVLNALKRGQYQKGSEVRGDMLRADGSAKSMTGYLGPIENKVSGGTMTEFSTDWEDVGIEIPTMVPTLSKKEIEYMQNMKPGQGWNVKENPMDKQIINKAREHARMRLEQDKNPFYQDGE